MVNHIHQPRAPVATEVLLEIARDQGLQQRLLAIVVFDPDHPVALGIEPHDLPGVAGKLVGRVALHNIAVHLTAGLVAQVPVGVFLDFLRTEVFEGEGRSHEGPRLVARADAFDLFQGRQVKPLVIRLESVRIG